MKSNQEKVRETISLAASEFERNGLCRSILRRCQREVPKIFLQQGLQVLLESNESGGYRFLAILLVRTPGIFMELTDRWNLTREQAVKAAVRLQKVEPNFDIQMVELLPDRNNTPKPFALKGESAERALELLDEISPGRRIVPMMRHLTDHSDANISSKAALLIGKRLQSVAWARRVIVESGQGRLRANAVETLWGLSDPSALDLFRECLRDWDNRVVGNGIIGLHKAGVPDTYELLAGIAATETRSCAMTAAWAMGEIGDASFTALLTPLAKDAEADVRRAALRSLRTLVAAGRGAALALAAG